MRRPIEEPYAGKPPVRFCEDAANKMAELAGESPVLTIIRNGQVVISGIQSGNNLYESPEVNGQSAKQECLSWNDTVA